MVRSGCVWAALAMVACGDNTLPVGTELVRSRDLTIVAHSDDDLVYLQPDQLERVTRAGSTIVYLTDGSDAADRRHLGLQAAYTAATGSRNWQCGWIQINGHHAEHCRLDDALLSLVFLGYPEGNAEGTSPTSIAKLWDGTLPIAITIGDLTASYTRADVIDTLAALVDSTQPRTVRTFDVGAHGLDHADHADHAVTGAAALLAIAASHSNPELILYRGDGTSADPANMIDPLFERSAGILAFYDGCAEGSAPCGEQAIAITEVHAAALRRRYAFSMRRAAGELRSNATDCVTADANGKLEIVPCPTTKRWRLAEDGTLRIGDLCIETLVFDGELVAGPQCTPTPARTFFLDDEGRLWAGVPPPLQPGDPAMCVAIVGDRPRATPCSRTSAPRWELSSTPKLSPRPSGLPATGRAIRLADLTGDGMADLCAVVAGTLRCAPGGGTGVFGALADLGTLPIEPESLAIGDVDNDGRLDACGRDASGLLCATATTNFVAERWSPGFAQAGPATAIDRSLAAVDSDDNGSAEICGLSPGGFACAQHDLGAIPAVRSPWPQPTMALWPGDLDGDRRADWCALTPTGVACGTDALAAVTTDGVPWTFSFAGVRDPAPADTTLGAMGDIDGDGRADLCGVFDRDGTRQIACARSQGFGFGPLATFATLPDANYVALWLGDLDGDGTADACADDGTTIYCAPAR